MTTQRAAVRDGPPDPQLSESPRQSLEISVVQMATTWAVQHSLSYAYRRLTGHDQPTARDADVPMRRILVWAATTAAAVAVANVVVDRMVLRPRGALPTEL